MSLRALVTNDDGVGSEGLRRLAQMAVAAGLDVVVAAPRDEASGSSASLTAVKADGRILVEEQHLDGLDGVPAYGVAAAPGFIALIAIRGAFGAPPDLVLSGINAGANTGYAILHSGTVGAALTARTQGRKGLAISLAGATPTNWDTATAVAQQGLQVLLATTEPVVLNVNVPDVPAAELRGLRRARLASFGMVQTTITEVGRGYVTLAVADVHAEEEPGTDATLVAGGFATLTPLNPICEVPDIALPGVELAPTGTRLQLVSPVAAPPRTQPRRRGR